MTTKEKLIQMCVDRGMSQQQAKEVVDNAVPDMNKEAGNYRITWNRPANEYPDVMYSTWFVTVARHAVEWIETNMPQAWFRPMFGG